VLSLVSPNKAQAQPYRIDGVIVPQFLLHSMLTRKLPQIENNMKIEASISLRRRDEEVKIHGEPDCWNLG